MSTPISFRRNEILLHGRFHRAEGNQRHPTVILLQGSPGNEEDVLGLGQQFAQSGYNALTFNYSGTQRSGGLSSFANSQLDIAAAYRFLDESDDLPVDRSRLVLGGWSYGGGMALTYAANNPEVMAVFSVAGTDHGEFMREYLRDADYRSLVDAIFDEMAAPDSPWRLAPGATPREVTEQHLAIDPYDLRLAAPSLADRHLLLIGGWDDLNVKIDNHLLPLYRALQSEGARHVSVVAFQDAHGFQTVRNELARAILDWMDNVLL